MLTCSKEYRDVPFAHRQHEHDGHCAWLHGHNWTFKFVFAAHEVDENGFVIDFGKLKWLKEWINRNFDHALVLNEDDPYLGYLEDVLVKPPKDPHNEPSYTGAFAKVLVVPNASSEGLAQWLFSYVNSELLQRTAGRVYLWSVKVVEDAKNAAQFAPGI